MLTATYSLVAIVNEQNSVRRMLCKLHHTIRSAWNGLHRSDIEQVESTFSSLAEFDTCCHQRKVEQYLIPAIRCATGEADALLEELDAISAAGMRLLRNIGDQLRHAVDAGSVRLHDVYASMDQYCDRLLHRLAREEEELFPIVRRVFSVEEWFSIAETFLSVDGQAHGGRLQAVPAPLRLSRVERQRVLH